MGSIKWLMLAAVPFGAGCATASLNPNRIPDAQASIKEAEAAGADKLPESSNYLKLAKEKLAEGQQFASTGDNARADMILLCSVEDANLAKQTAEYERLRAEYQEIQARLKALGGN